MIIGIGQDLVDIRRIEKVINRFDDRFIHRCFTEQEIKKAQTRYNAGLHIATYAKRFAAKEACAKALGVGFSGGILMREIGVVDQQGRAPALELTGKALTRLNDITPSGHHTVLHLTMTDEPPLASAFVIIEARPVS